MKRFVGIFLCSLMMLSLTACVPGEVMSQLEDIAEGLEALQTGTGIGSLPAESQDVDNSVTTEESNTEQTEDAVQSAQTDLYERWSAVVGYWNSAEGRFAVPDMEDSHTAVFRYGMWDSEFDSGYGRVAELTASGEQELTALVAWDRGDREDLTVIVNYSGLDQDGKIRIKIGEEDWLQYMYAGATGDEAYRNYIS